MIPHPGRAEQRFWRRWLGPLPANGSELMSVATRAKGKVMLAIRPFLLIESSGFAPGTGPGRSGLRRRSCLMVASRAWAVPSWAAGGRPTAGQPALARQAQAGYQLGYPPPVARVVAGNS